MVVFPRRSQNTPFASYLLFVVLCDVYATISKWFIHRVSYWFFSQILGAIIHHAKSRKPLSERERERDSFRCRRCVFILSIFPMGKERDLSRHDISSLRIMLFKRLSIPFWNTVSRNSIRASCCSLAQLMCRFNMNFDGLNRFSTIWSKCIWFTSLGTVPSFV